MRGQQRIESMFAFVVVDEDGTEGVLSFLSGATWLPMVGADLARVEQLRPLAQDMANQLHKPVELLHFIDRVQVGVLQPQPDIMLDDRLFER